MHKVRLKDVAARAGVAVNTASTILNRRPNSWASKETEERVFVAAAELGYEPNRAAQALRCGRFQAIGVLIPDFHDGCHIEFANAFRTAAADAGFDVLLESWQRDCRCEQRLIHSLRNRPVDGIVAFLSGPEAAHIDPSDGGLGIPFVRIGFAGQGQDLTDSVLTDLDSGLEQAIDALLSLGHQRFAFLSPMPEGQPVCPGAESFSRILARKCIAHSAVTAVTSEASLDSVLRTATRLFSDPAFRPTALITTDANSALTAARAAGMHGLRIPDDLSVVAIGDSPIAPFLPISMSAIAFQIMPIAESAVSILTTRIDDHDQALEPTHATFPSIFVRRESVARAR